MGSKAVQGCGGLLLPVLVFLMGGYIIVLLTTIETTDFFPGAGEPALMNLAEVDNLRSLVATQQALLEQYKADVSSGKLAKPSQPQLRTGDHVAAAKSAELQAAVAAVAARAEARGTRSAVESHKGLVILGMHRSGTSLTAGLINQMGAEAGGPLIGPAKDNKKGFFERVDVVLQNDRLFKLQGLHYSMNTQIYDDIQALSHIFEIRRLTAEMMADPVRKAAEEGKPIPWSDIQKGRPKARYFNEGERALTFFYKERNVPWMLKDPRLCITLKTWMPLFKTVPAILFTYRHPADVAKSMLKRDQFKFERGLRLWYVYNMRAVQNSNDLCRVVSSNKAMMLDTKTEIKRVHDELKDRCGLQLPREPTPADIAQFVDSSLNHGNKRIDECNGLAKDPLSLITLMPPENAFEKVGRKESALWQEAIRVYCAMEDGSAFQPHFKWQNDMVDHHV